MNETQQFSEILKKLLQGQSISRLAKAAGIDRSAIYRAKRGESFSEKSARALASALQLTPADQAEFFKAWSQTRPDKANFPQGGLVEQFVARVDELSSLYAVKGVLHSPVSQDLSLFSKPAQPIYGNLSIRKILQIFIEHEAAKEAGHICLRLPPDRWFVEAFFPIMDNHTQLTIDHILCFSPTIEVESTPVRNFDYLCNILPFLVAGCRYSPQVYYDRTAHSQADILPYLILTGDCALCISGNFESAVLYRSEEMHQFFEKQFSLLSAGSTPLVRKLTPEAHLAVFSDLARSLTPGKSLFYMNYEPCMAPYYDQEFLTAFVSPRLPNRAALTAGMLNYSALLLQKASCFTGCFSLSGLRSFLDTGALSEIPPGFYTPVPLPLRLRLVRALYEGVEKGQTRTLALTEHSGPYPPCLTLGIYPSAVVLIINLPGREYLSVLLEEPSIVSIFSDYFSKISTSGAVYSHGETLEKMREILRPYQTP